MKTTVYNDLYTPEGESAAGGEWDVYPRPQLVRDSFFSLNGTWDFTAGEGNWESITVPFPPESLLSGIHRHMGKQPRLMYKKDFALPKGFVRDRVILHFGAVDQIATVTLNGTVLGEHHGGYAPFSFDITDHLQGSNTLVVEVTDNLQDKILPYGKQCEKRGGMWYTPVSGIWQTVWIESVPAEYVRSLQIDTGADYAVIRTEGVTKGTVTVTTPAGDVSVPMRDGVARVDLPSPRMWSPEDPYLYEFTVQTESDTVRSYFALRTLDIREVNGISRLCLNGKPYFFHGVLDQGYFSDGIFTPASPKCYDNDILAMKNLGFNMLRKHIKIEPEYFYYACDRLGMIVFQDMVNNGDYSFFRDTALPTAGLKSLPDRYLHRDPATRQAFIRGMEETVAQLHNHPSVCCWTIFNEGWGQFDSDNMYRRLKELDSTRFIDTASGWFRGGASDVDSQHVYFKPVKLKPSDKPIFLSEFGGYVYRVEEHVFNPDKTYGYRIFDDRQKFEDALMDLYEKEVLPHIGMGLCAAVYTQLSDVEDETNGLLTYDRKVCKVDASRMRDMAAKLKI
ncbi:MAG: glycoside hydrolase family 2 [Clostridia bacterium]|nr:glycoside hydrolase family 2 [Clostridia bacterium]